MAKKKKKEHWWSRLISEMPGIEPPDYVVDNRAFLLGLDQFYRDAIRVHEGGELLDCARRVAGALGIGPADVPVEGYYTETPELTEYFRLVRALQATGASSAGRVEGMPEFQRLRDVATSRLYGVPHDSDALLPQPWDAMTFAARATTSGWRIALLMSAAYDAAVREGDISLVGLAARSRDPIVLTALRESVVLYSLVFLADAGGGPEKPRFVWEVDEQISEAAKRFVDLFQQIFGDELPAPVPKNAMSYWSAARTTILGRCARLGIEDSRGTLEHYHWAIREGGETRLDTHEFWRSEICTTAMYHEEIGEPPPGEERPEIPRRPPHPD